MNLICEAEFNRETWSLRATCDTLYSPKVSCQGDFCVFRLQVGLVSAFIGIRNHSAIICEVLKINMIIFINACIYYPMTTAS